MIILAAFILTIAVLVFVAYPLFLQGPVARLAVTPKQGKSSRPLPKGAAAGKAPAKPAKSPAPAPKSARAGSGTDDEIEKQVQARRKTSTGVCPACGLKSKDTDKFCAGCGQRLK